MTCFHELIFKREDPTNGAELQLKTAINTTAYSLKKFQNVQSILCHLKEIN